MKIASHSIVVIAPQERVWQTLLDWQHWTLWDSAMESIHFDGPIDVGSQGKFKMKAGPSVILHVDSVNEGRSYTDHFKLLGTKYIFKHVIAGSDAGAVNIRFDIEMEGPTAFIFGPLSKAKFGAFLPEVLGNLKTYLEAQTAHNA